MSKRPDAPSSRASRGGRPELLTAEMASKIARMVGTFPDHGIEVTWENVIAHVERRFGHRFHRNVLSQKKFDGRKIITEAFRDAKAIVRRQVAQEAPKYASATTTKLRLLLQKREAEILALRELLDNVRSQQYSEHRSLLDLRTPMHAIVELRSTTPPATKAGDSQQLTAASAAPGKAARMHSRRSGSQAKPRAKEPGNA